MQTAALSSFGVSHCHRSQFVTTSTASRRRRRRLLFSKKGLALVPNANYANAMRAHHSMTRIVRVRTRLLHPSIHPGLPVDSVCLSRVALCHVWLMVTMWHTAAIAAAAAAAAGGKGDTTRRTVRGER